MVSFLAQSSLRDAGASSWTVRSLHPLPCEVDDTPPADGPHDSWSMCHHVPLPDACSSRCGTLQARCHPGRHGEAWTLGKDLSLSMVETRSTTSSGTSKTTP